MKQNLIEDGQRAQMCQKVFFEKNVLNETFFSLLT